MNRPGLQAAGTFVLKQYCFVSLSLFTSTLRALQMRCTYIHTTGHAANAFLSLELGRTVEDAPDVGRIENKLSAGFKL